MKKINTRIQLKHDTTENWANANLIPLKGEVIIYDSENSTEPSRVKIGDGVTPVSALPFSIENEQVNNFSGVSTTEFVSEEALPYAELKKVGGNTVRVDNTLQHTAVTKIISTEENLFGGERLADTIVGLVSGEKNIASETVKWSSAVGSGKTLFDKFKPSTQYTLILEGSNVDGTNYTNLRIKYSDGTYSIVPKFDSNKVVFTSDANKTVDSLRFVYYSGTTTLYYNKCGIFEGSLSAEEFTPYIENTFTIPEEVLNLKEYGCSVSEDVYNYVDFVEKKFVKKVAKFIATGEEDWQPNGGDPSKNYFVCKLGELGTVVNYSAICNKYDNVNDGLSGVEEGMMLVNSNGWGYAQVAIRPDNVASLTVSSFKSMLRDWYVSGSPLEVVYELMSPEITELSEVLYSSDLKVKPKGIVTFVNSYNQDVAYDIDFYMSTKQVIGATKVVGDLLGTASRACSDELGRNILSTYVSAGEDEWVFDCGKAPT